MQSLKITRMKSPKDLYVSRMIPAMGHIALDTDICAGCNMCEVVCALIHEGVISPKFARLRIIDYYLGAWVTTIFKMLVSVRGDVRKREKVRSRPRKCGLSSYITD